jgi:predicted nucleic-acid-binding protein
LKAVDSNVLLRLITADDPPQEAIARALIAEHDIFVSLTSVLETEWVLRSFYRWSRDADRDALGSLDGFENIQLERADQLLWAVERMRRGGRLRRHDPHRGGRRCDRLRDLRHDIERDAGVDSPRPVQTLR